MSTQHKHKKGFSLIEIMIAIFIMGLLIAMVAPNFGRYNKNRQLESAARRIIADMRMMRHIAIGQHHRVKIVFNEANSSYVVYVDLDDDGLYETSEIDRTIDIHDYYPTVSFSRSSAVPANFEPVPVEDLNAVSFGAPPENWTGFTFVGSALRSETGSGSQSGCIFLMLTESMGTNSTQQIAVGVFGSGTVKAYRFTGSAWLDFI